MSMSALIMRSKLFVPGSRPELFAKAMASEADALSIDLEDAVDKAARPKRVARSARSCDRSPRTSRRRSSCA
jgi:citrate lyase subunit beta/citryl-CoA lyase